MPKENGEATQPPERYTFSLASGTHDWGQIANLREVLGSAYPPTSPEDARPLVPDLDPTTLLMATLGMKAVGSVQMSPRNSGDTLAKNLGVDPEHQSRGIGKELVRITEAMRWFLVGATQNEAQTDNDSLVKWYQSQGYGGDEDHEYTTKGLLKDILLSDQEMWELLDRVIVPDGMAIDAHINIYERNLYFSLGNKRLNSRRYGRYASDSVDDLSRLLGESGHAALQGVTFEPNDTGSGELYVPTTMPEIVHEPGSSDATGYRVWHGICGYSQPGNTPVRLLRLDEYPHGDYSDIAGDNLNVDGRYIALTGHYKSVFNNQVIAFSVEDGGCRLMDEKESNRFYLELLRSVSYYSSTKPPHMPVTNPERLNQELDAMRQSRPS